MEKSGSVDSEFSIGEGFVQGVTLNTAQLTLAAAVQLCCQQVQQMGLVLHEEMIMPFRLENCMLFLSKVNGQLQVDVAVSAPVEMDCAIKSQHLNTRFVMNEMVARAVKLYGSRGEQSFAMSFLFRDGCGLVKLEQGKDYLVDLIEHVPVVLAQQVEFAVIRSDR